jgi:thiamine-phosphate pyrophosphorylase
MTSDKKNSRIYAITDEKLLPPDKFLKKAEQAMLAGVRIIQFREKESSMPERIERGKQLVSLADYYKTKIVVNDDPVLAKKIGAHGVHLGKDDADIKMARFLLGENAIIGVSCYGDVELAIDFQNKGADYVAFGAFFSSPTKPDEPIVPIAILKEAAQKVDVPIVAIGGINHDNAKELVDNEADYLAVVSAIFSDNSVLERIQKLNLLVGDIENERQIA